MKQPFCFHEKWSFFSFVQFRMSRKPLNDSITLCYHSPCASSGEFLKVGMLSPMVSMYMRSFSWAVHKVAHLYTDLSRNILSAEIFFSFCGWEISHYNLNFHFSYFINKLEHLFMWLQVICSLFFWEFSVYLGSVSVKLLALFSSLLESSHFVRKSQNIHLSY